MEWRRLELIYGTTLVDKTRSPAVAEKLFISVMLSGHEPDSGPQVHDQVCDMLRLSRHVDQSINQSIYIAQRHNVSNAL